MKVIYLGHHALGDAVMKVPAIRYLIIKFGEENVYFTARDVGIKIFLTNYTPLRSTNVLIYNKDLTLYQKLQFILLLRRKKFDYFILPPTINSRNGRILFKLSWAKKLISHYSIHSKPKRNEVYVNEFKHKVYQNIEFVRFFESWTRIEIEDFVKKNYFLTNLIDDNLKKFNLRDNYFIVHPGSGGNFHKRYPLVKWISLIEKIRVRYPKYKIYITGTGKENQLADEIKSNFFNDPLVINLVNQYSLDDSMTIIRNSILFISADCGPIHLASIMKTKMITIFGPTDYYITGPFSHSTVVHLTPQLSCMPCHLSKKYKNKGCKTVDCMNLLSNDDVFSAITNIVQYTE